jgi:hypothetical protein
MNSVATPVVIAHNGFGGDMVVEDIKSQSGTQAIVASEQGFGVAANEASKVDHPLRNTVIRAIQHTYTGLLTSGTGNAGVYIQFNVDGVSISDVRVYVTNINDVDSNTTLSAIRIDGIAVGAFSVEKVSANKIGQLFFSNGDSDGATSSASISRLHDLTSDFTNKPIQVQGDWGISVDDLAFDSIIGSVIIEMESQGAGTPKYLAIGGNVKTPSDKQIYKTTVTVEGSIVQSSNLIGSAITVGAGYNFTAEEIQNRGMFAELVSPVAGGTVTMGDFPEPYVNGQIITLSHTGDGARQAILIPGTISTIAADITLSSTAVAKQLLAKSGVWKEIKL